MKKIVKLLQTVERTVGDPWIGDVSYTLNINEADPLIKNGWAVLVAEVPDGPATGAAEDQAKPKAAKKRAAPKRSAESVSTKKAGKKK